MITKTEAAREVGGAVAAHDGSDVEWSAILAGSVIGGAIVSVFSTFGAALGLASISPYEGDGSATAALLAVGTWMIWTTVSGIMAGAYVAGRMRRCVDAAVSDEVSVRDGIHGLAVWGVSVLIGAWLLGAATDDTAVIARTGVAAGADAITIAAHNASIVAAFVTAATLFVAAAGAYWAAGAGGRHRDKNRAFPHFGTWN